ncbi:glycoside hydrolase family 5 protein [Hyphomicrobium sp.]|uniref:glycoside hydrolase family 5 protein n=1 Tax=Hyphomicrobium sp. TaxID=82 RepID=UPI002D7A38AA|nr:glycoside hydrolase family 5 protein [Hyphomicrobium sp.]HET6390229.1 glycoside hydrolase family 5 protein [Hyphomicrobium sp.]
MHFRPTRRNVLVVGGATIAAQAFHIPAARSVTQAHYAGVNVAGGEFGKIPGRYGYDYAFPTQSNLSYFATQGFNIVRIPFRWERLQPQLNAELDAAELKQLKATVDAATKLRLTVVLDTHNYAKRRVSSDNWKDAFVIGSQTVPAAAFTDFCRRLATAFKDNNSIFFGLMNEPTGIKAPEWLPIANDAIAAMRAAGANQLILVPGVNYTGAHSWISSGNDVMANIADPANNFAIEVHQYLDKDSSGTSGTVMSASIGTDRLQAFQNWARSKKLKAFLGEFAAGRDAASLEALDNICNTLRENKDVWLGWTAWAGGGWWPDDYFFNLTPAKDGTPRPQIATLSRQAKAFIQ